MSDNSKWCNINHTLLSMLYIFFDDIIQLLEQVSFPKHNKLDPDRLLNPYSFAWGTIIFSFLFCAVYFLKAK